MQGKQGAASVPRRKSADLRSERSTVHLVYLGHDKRANQCTEYIGMG